MASEKATVEYLDSVATDDLHRVVKDADYELGEEAEILGDVTAFAGFPAATTGEVNNGGVIMAIYPVCKMKVDEKKAPATNIYNETKYYFCSVGYKKAFDANPEKYLSSR
jgi:YHS domain-containing protein